MPISFDQKQQFFHLKNHEISYVIGIEKGKYLTHRYFGKTLSSYHGCNELQRIDRGFATNPIPADRTFSLNALPMETSTQGNGDHRIANYQIRNQKGHNVTDFHFQDFDIYNGKKELTGLPSVRSAKTTTLEIRLVDSIQQLEMILVYNLYEDFPVITRSARYRNLKDAPVYLENAGSLMLDLPRWNFDLITLNGAHTNEATLHRQALHPGIQKIESSRGTSSPQHQPFLALANPETTEFTGEVFAFHFVYSGNFTAQVEVEQYGSSRVQIGIQPETFEWKLTQDHSFQTPEVVMNYSEDGFNGMSQTFHRLYQTCLIPEQFSQQERPILLNTWEANYFDLSAEALLTQARQAKELGIELFVLDDGWFGKRNDDTSSLGDWSENREKLPQGLSSLAREIRQMGLKFGIWFEPEMVSKESKLFRQHPNWALHVSDYPMTEGRRQLVLDLSRKEVQDYLIDQLGKQLASGQIDYVKWDMNRHLTEVGNTLLPADQQKESHHRYVLGLYRIIKTLTEEFPTVLFENCSSGGGRFDPGMMAYMPQTWTSDNSDALCRTKIQYGYSYLYPPIMMGAHVSDVPNHQVGRLTPFSTRGWIAMSGNFGYELDLMKQSADNLRSMQEQINFYKAHRQLLQFGEFYRLQAPDTQFASAWLFKNDQEALLIYSNGLAQPAVPIHYLKTVYLDSDAIYQDTETENRYSGAELNQAGILIPRIKQDFETAVYHWKKL
ncbi:alpha-galactosidase [Enterococcus devriesei]|uniref:alpha-galactosidase n=1 Tax=Enterococcus devriesei TaxID=319970 RepID=UPI001C103766|nr:alpha-galactosidase [Enterococcus devriesei]MBU5365772.1 alpha-galactosidase [Enterococcus devriesei]MDT2821922.1 alpha-galactosidase [Enterococcus devriesei]